MKLNTGLAKNFICFFSVRMALVALSCLLTSFNFVRLYCESCHIRVHFKKLIRIGEFLCSHFIIEDGRKSTFSAYYIIPEKVKTRETKDLCSVWRRCCDWLNMSEVVCEVSCWRSLTDDAPRSGRPGGVDSDQTETLLEITTL